MGYITRLPTAGAASLPTLGDIGYISRQSLKGLYLINAGSGLIDSSGSGNNLTLVAGTVTPPYSAGVLQFRGQANGAQQLSTGTPIAGPNSTIIVVAKKTGAGAAAGQVYAAHAGAILAGSTAGPMTIWDDAANFQSWGQQSKRPSIAHVPAGQNIGQWNMLASTRDASGISLSLNGQAPVSVAYNTADPGTTTSANVVLGDSTTARPIEGDIGFFAVWERAMVAAEIASVYKAVRRMMLAKGIAL